MVTTTIRVSVNGMDMPFLYRDANRAVMLPGLDQIPNPLWRRESQDWNLPHTLFVENVMPVSKGLLSTTLSSIVASSAFTNFDQAIILRDDQENNALLCPALGANYLLKAGVWTSVLPFASAGGLVTRAYTQGRSFVFYQGQKLYEYSGTGGTLIDQTASLVLPTGTTLAQVRGIGGASNYLLLFTTVGVLWSSPTDPLNFNRLLNNGSGYQIPQDLRGEISAILPVAGGAIIYTVRNAVAAVFTNNAAVPFAFRGITNAGGVASYEQVAYDADEQFQYIWGSGGMQAVTLQSATDVFPELSDFLTSGIFEYFDYTAHKVVSLNTGSSVAVKLTYVSQRFLVVSYGRTAGSYEYAYIYDTALTRWGKVKVAHVDCFTYPYPGIVGNLTYAQLATSYSGLGTTTYTGLGIGVISTSPPKKSIAFMDNTGNISILSMDYSLRSQVGVAVVGQIQMNRGNYTTLLGVEAEGIDQTSPAHCYALVSENGKSVDHVTEFLTVGTPTTDYQSFSGRETAANHNVAIVGAFQLTGMLVKVSKHGKI